MLVRIYLEVPDSRPGQEEDRKDDNLTDNDRDLSKGCCYVELLGYEESF